MSDIITETRVAIQAMRNGILPPKRGWWHALRVWYYTKRLDKATADTDKFANRLDLMLSPLEKLYWAMKKNNVTPQQFQDILENSDALLSSVAGAAIAKADKLPFPQA